MKSPPILHITKRLQEEKKRRSTSKSSLQPALVETAADHAPASSQADVAVANESLPPAPDTGIVLAYSSGAFVPVALG